MSDAARPTEGAYAALLTFENGAFASLTYGGYGHFDSDEFSGWIGEMGQTKSPDAPQPALHFASADEETALVKATSFVSEIAPELVPPGERALFMYAKPRNYIASILAGENSVKELEALAPSRAQRMGNVASPAPSIVFRNPGR